MSVLSRRLFLQRALGAGLMLGTAGIDDLLAYSLVQSDGSLEDPWRHGTRIGLVDFQVEPTSALDTLFGDGLDARLYTDLSSVDARRPLIPPERFFVRTGVPDGLKAARPWMVRIDGHVNKPHQPTVEQLQSDAGDMGVHIIECAGNTRWTRFGLISAARWSGVPLMALLEQAGPTRAAATVRISGSDDHSQRSTNSEIGCSWIFDLETLARTGAFLATTMGERPLRPEHGAPVRLVVPGWYGCCCIKWVDRIELMDDEQPATTQMMEFAERTHQDGVPERAADYLPATVDTTALPIRVEAWRIGDQIEYRVVGILWGGSGSTDRLAIRFGPQEPYRLVTEQPVSTEPGSWALWSHRWQPPGTGRYLIQLAVDDPGVRTRRLDMGTYARAVAL